MNAHELEIIQATLVSQGNLIKEQADRIAELEKELAFMEGEYPEPTIVQKMQEFANLEQALNRIVELEKLLQESAMHNISVTSQADEHYARVQELQKRLERYQMALEHYKNKADYLDKRELELLAMLRGDK